MCSSCYTGRPAQSISPELPFTVGCLFTSGTQFSAASHRDFAQADILDRGPDDREATGLCREDINLIGALTHEAPETFDGIGGLNVSMHGSRELVKREEVLFILTEAPHRFWIALALLSFKSHQLGHRLLFIRLLPDSDQFGLDVVTFSARDSRENVALLMHQASLTRGS